MSSTAITLLERSGLALLLLPGGPHVESTGTAAGGASHLLAGVKVLPPSSAFFDTLVGVWDQGGNLGSLSTFACGG